MLRAGEKKRAVRKGKRCPATCEQLTRVSLARSREGQVEIGRKGKGERARAKIHLRIFFHERTANNRIA